MTSRSLMGCLLLGLGLLVALPAAAQTPSFTLNRYEPTPAGEWSVAVDHPWYSATRSFAGGLTFNYARSPLIYGLRTPDVTTRDIQVISSQLHLHVDLAVSFVNRVTLAASLPVVLLERGTAVAGAGPMAGGAAGDPRLSAMVRLYGDPETRPFSVNLGAYLWAPLGVSDHAGDRSVRFLPKLVLAGLGQRVRWSATAGFYYRARARIGLLEAGPGNSAGPELQLGASVQYADPLKRFAVGPEASFGTVVVGGSPFTRDYSSLELLLGAHYHVKRQVMLSLAGGVGLLRQPGTPEFRVLLRIAYAPSSRRSARPRGERYIVLPEPGGKSGAVAIDDGRTTTLLDRPGVQAELGEGGKLALRPLPPEEVARLGERVDAELPVPRPDRDFDSVPDDEDACPERRGKPSPEAARSGCPRPVETYVVLPEADGKVGAIVVEHDGKSTLIDRPAMALEVYADGHSETRALTPAEVEGLHGAAIATLPSRGPDRDRDGVPDSEDACPERAGKPSAEARKNGCPRPVETYVVLREASGKVGAVNVEQGGKTTLIDQPGVAVEVYADGHNETRALSPEELERLGGDALAAMRRHEADRDQDGVADADDGCLGESAGLQPDPARPGCPLPDGDHDMVADIQDACPSEPGSPDPDPKKNGCPGLVYVRDNVIHTQEPVYFALGGDEILPRSFPILQAVAKVLEANPSIRRLSIEGHTDNLGVAEANRDLSARRAKSVERWLVEHGVAAARLETQGYGPDRPIAPNTTPAGQAKNRRVEFRVIDPPPATKQTK